MGIRIPTIGVMQDRVRDCYYGEDSEAIRKAYAGR
jgi:hypothetical protein